MVKDATEATARVELHAKCQTISVDRCPPHHTSHCFIPLMVIAVKKIKSEVLYYTIFIKLISFKQQICQKLKLFFNTCK